MWNPCEGHERDSNAGSGTDTCIGPPVTRRQYETHVAALELKLNKRMRHIERLDEVIRRRNKQVEELSEMLLATREALNDRRTVEEWALSAPGRDARATLRMDGAVGSPVLRLSSADSARIYSHPTSLDEAFTIAAAWVREQKT